MLKVILMMLGAVVVVYSLYVFIKIILPFILLTLVVGGLVWGWFKLKRGSNYGI